MDKKQYNKPVINTLGSVEEVTTWSPCNSEFYSGGNNFLCPSKGSRGRGPADFGS